MKTITLLAFGVAVLWLTIPVAGQQPGTRNEPASSRPWPPPRLPDGQPDVQGLWRPIINGTQSLTTPMTGEAEFTARITGIPVRNPSRIVDPPNGQIPYQPWAAEKKKENMAKAATADPLAECFLPGVPRVTYLPFPFRIAQTPNALAILYEAGVLDARGRPLERPPRRVVGRACCRGAYLRGSLLGGWVLLGLACAAAPAMGAFYYMPALRSLRMP